MILNLSPEKKGIDFGRDSIVVRKFINGILGGVTLDITGYQLPTVLAGQCVITDGNGVYKPMPIKGETYGDMPEGFKYAGVVYRSAKATDGISIMFRGVVNKYAAPYYFKSDFDLVDIVFSNDLDDANPYQNYDYVDDPAELQNMAGKDVQIGADAVNSLTNSPYFRNALITNAEVDKTITIKATEKATLDNITVAGEQGVSNGKIIFAAKGLELKNIKAEANSTLYNAFEGAQSTDQNYKGIEKVVAENLNIDCPSLKHNIINVYTPKDGAEIIIKDSKFNLTVDNSNILRMANYLNAENVSVTFENVDWTYENSLTTSAWPYAGLVIYQPAASDVALGGDTSKFATWKFIFKDCRYNGVKVTENNFGEHSQVFYMYNVGGGNKVEDPIEMVEGISVEFK